MRWMDLCWGVAGLLLLGCSSSAGAQEWPELPTKDGSVEIPVQEWPLRPGARVVKILVHFPGGDLAKVNAHTGLMLTLHNWGGTDCIGTAAPDVLARELNVVAICVNYLQSGPVDSIQGPEPYDFGYLQALDALRALWFVKDSLEQRGIAFADDRMFCTGGSGGGNVTLMANKLAPRTFACVIDLCGMKKLSHDIAFAEPSGSDLNARWSRDPASANYLSSDAQELRFVGHPAHLKEMQRLGATAKVLVVHGINDTTCPYADAQEMVSLMQSHHLNVEPHFVTEQMLDGTVFKSTGHSLGDRTQIVLKLAGAYLRSGGQESLRRMGLSDFDRLETIRYATGNGTFEISYEAGFPTGRFAPAIAPPEYSEHRDLLYWLDAGGDKHPLRSAEAWSIRRDHIRRHLERVMGSLPSPVSRVPLDPVITEDVRLMPPEVSRPILRRKLTYQSDSTDRVSAYLMLPLGHEASGAADVKALPAVLCLQQTTDLGKDETAGIRGDAEMRYALELAERGFVTLTPDYPSFGEHAYDFGSTHGYASGSMKAVWDNIRAVDFLQSLPEVDRDRIGCIGHSLGGHNAIFTGMFEPRLKVIVSSCGFSSLQEDDVASWSGPRYMPRIATEFGNDAKRVPFDFHELIAALAPRPFLAVVADQDNDFAVSGVRDVMTSALPVYQLFKAENALQSYHADVPHSFPQMSREAAYDFLQRHLMAP